MPMPVTSQFSQTFHQVGSYYAASAWEQLKTYEEYQRPLAGRWYLDFEASTWLSDGKTVHQAPIGSLGTDNSWLWAWANNRTHPLGSERRELSLQLQRFGEKHEVYEFVEPRLELDSFPAPIPAAERLALTAMGVLGARGYASVEMETGARAYFLIDDETVPLAPFRRQVLSSVFHEALGVFASFPRLVAEGYLRLHGFEVWEDDQNCMHARSEGYTVSIRFDDQDRVIAVSHGEDRD
ncbi:DUF6882 domain-containing protein [Streptomyces sp. 8N114]|uniref:DUF6882 domain-containing protein n=1 Tax=Streptomyces sp. 8N114 TaxID=3457419 RepID=UPI003FD43827